MIDDDMPPSTQERLCAAFHSSDLSLEPGKRKDVDHLIALGWAVQENGRASSALMRLHLASSQHGYRAARESVVAMTKRIGSVKHWRLSMPNLSRVGEIALAHHIFPACPVCHGRKLVVAEGAPYLSGAICSHCGGTGERPVQRRWNDEIRYVIEVLRNIDRVTERAVARRLR